MNTPEGNCPTCVSQAKRPKTQPKRSDDPLYWAAAVEYNIRVIEGILATGILDKYQRDNVHGITLASCAFTQLLINLSDLLTKASIEGLRLTFQPESVEIDITTQIVTMRNAACHSQSPESRLGLSIWKFGMETLFDGDIAYSYGRYGIAFHKALVPVFNDVRKRLTPLLMTPVDSVENPASDVIE